MLCAVHPIIAMKHHLSIFAAVSILLALSSAEASVLRDTSFPTADKRSLQIEMTVMPVFPATLIASGITEGQARILISVDAEGVLTDWLVLAYTNELFATEAIDAIERWKFDPMLVRGEAMSCQTEMSINYEATGVVVSMNLNSFMLRTSSFCRKFFRGRLRRHLRVKE